MSVILWPDGVLKPRTPVSAPDPQTVSGGRSLTGKEAVIPTDTGFWRITLGNVPVKSVQQQKCWEAVSALLLGRANSICVPVYKKEIAPWPVDANGKRLPRTGLTFSGGLLFSSGVGFASDLIVATIRAAALRATTVTIDLVQGATLEPGQVFGIGYSRAHRIRTVAQDGNAYTCSISPPLREPVADGTRVNFDNPRVECVLTSDNAMTLEYDLGRFATGTVEFQERW